MCRMWFNNESIVKISLQIILKTLFALFTMTESTSETQKNQETQNPDEIPNPQDSYVKLAMRNMVKKKGVSLKHFFLTVFGLLTFLIGMSYLTR